MLKTKEKLTIFHDDNSSFTDYSKEGLDFDRDNFTVTLDSATSYLYIGFDKPINFFYTEIDTANINAGSFVGEYYNGTTWTSLVGFHDETNSFIRSGFIQWDRGQTSETKTTINSVEKFWYRLQPSVTHSATVIKGLNLTFSDDTDLKREFFEVSEFLPNGETSHILSHVAARDQIIQAIRQGGVYKVSAGEREDISAFDFHDVSQVKLASVYLTLSKILGSVMDDPDDIYMNKSISYNSMYSLLVKTPFIDIDKNDDGIKDASENKQFRTLRVFRE